MIDKYFSELTNAILHLDRKVLTEIVQILKEHENGRVFVIGNGGSATTASHIAGDLFKTCKFDAFCLSDSNYLVTAIGNDIGFHRLFAAQLKNIISSDDVLIAISGSGKSPNIIDAVDLARFYEANIIGLTGFDGGLLKGLCDLCLVVPSDKMEVIEDVHLAIGHCIVECLNESSLQAESVTK